MDEARRTLTTTQAQLDVLTAPDTARIDLGGQAAAPAASGRAYWSRSRGLVLSAANLPPLPADRTYQLWVLTANSPVSAGLLQPDAAGRVSAAFPTPADLPQPAGMAISIEPAGGVPAPTGAIYLAGRTG
jgi:anti-sigma-K factor RskA